jgi:hypothetical protein
MQILFLSKKKSSIEQRTLRFKPQCDLHLMAKFSQHQLLLELGASPLRGNNEECKRNDNENEEQH